MQKLNFKQIKFKGQVITPIHIWSGKVWDRLDYFIFEGWEEIQIVERQWLNHCASEDLDLFQKILKSIEKGDFVELENLKRKYYDKYFDPDKFLIEEIPISEEAMKHLTMQDKNYSNFNKQGFRGNLGEVKRFSFNKFGKLIIPGSTLKGLFRTMFLMDLVKDDENYISQASSLSKLDKKLNKDFTFFQVEDIEVKDVKIEIRGLSLFTESGDIPVICQVLSGGEFEFDIFYDERYFRNVDFKKLLVNYSMVVIGREEKILQKFPNLGDDLLDKLDSLYSQGKYPVKIGMFKKSLTYKLFWEEELEDVYQKLIELFKRKGFIDFEKVFKELQLNKFGFKNTNDFKRWFLKNKNRNKKATQVVGQKLGIGDRSFYIDESDNPVGWISLEFLNK